MNIKNTNIINERKKKKKNHAKRGFTESLKTIENQEEENKKKEN